MNQTYTPQLLLPPNYIYSDEFIVEVSNVKRYKQIEFHPDIWFKAIVGNVLSFLIPHDQIFSFCKSIKGLCDNSMILYEELLYLEGLQNLSKIFLDERELRSNLVAKYNFQKSPYIMYGEYDDEAMGKAYTLLYTYNVGTKRTGKLGLTY